MFWNLNILNTTELCAIILIELYLSVLMLFVSHKVKTNIFNVTFDYTAFRLWNHLPKDLKKLSNEYYCQ